MQNPFGLADTFSLALGDTLMLNIASQDSALSYQWFRGTDTIFGATDTVLVIPNITPADSGVYTCRSYGTALLSPPMIFGPGIGEFVSEPIQVNVSTVGVEESNVLSSIVIYPNPSNGQFIIEINSENPDKAELRIFNLLGKEVHHESILYLNNTYRLLINLNNYQKGIYFLTLNTSEGRHSQKLIVQ
ncbi:MAG: T9SS type A sorting domain-containing protein [Bacteroidetes bacterium]|nr:T9SS type A sorting domain-containing protein [Bacteroidota bacterium]